MLMKYRSNIVPLVAVIVLLTALNTDANAATCTSRQNGDWSQSNRWNCGTGASNGPPGASDDVVINHNINLNTSPTVASVTVNQGLTQTGGSTRTLTVTGDYVNYGSTNDNGNSGRFDLVVGGNLTSTNSFTTDNLRVSGSATISGGFTVRNTFTINGNLTKNSDAMTVGTLVFNATGTQSATFYGANSTVGNLTVNSTSTVSSSNYSTLAITGNLTNSGTLSLPNSTFTFNGSAAQSTSGNAFTVGNMTLDNAAGLTLGANATVSTVLTFSDGRLTTGSNTLSLSGNCPGSISGYNSSRYVIGNLRLTFPSWDVTCVYPVGTGVAGYAPITVAIPWFSGIAGGTLTGTTVGSEHPQIATSGIDPSQNVNRYWTLGAAGDTMQTLPAAGSYNLILGFVAADVDTGATVSTFKVGLRDGASWLTPAGSASGTSASLPIQTKFGNYAVGSVNQPPTVSAITRANPSPTSALSVSWNVTFSEPVTGVNAADFSLVHGGGLSSGGIMSVTGSGTNWVVQASTGFGTGTLGLNLVDDDSIVDAAGSPLGGSGAGNGNYVGQIYEITPAPCPPPSNVPAGITVTCQCDNFTRGTLNPSTIFGGNWIATTSDTTGIIPRIVNSGYLRLTESTGNNAKAATVPGIFPAAGNYISVEFLHYAYNGSNPGADGIAITLSDYAVPAQPGAFGGSLGYAQRSGVVGFAGGWIGVALDEYGNYQNPTEGRLGGTGFIAQSVGLRGSGSGMSGYRWLAGTAALTPLIDNRASTTPAPGHRYQIVVDARDEASGTTAVAVNRDTTGSGTYTSLISVPNIKAAAASAGFTQADVPDHWQISFTGSTGGSRNIHEIAGLKICAQAMIPPTGGTLGGFNVIDEVYTRGNLNALQGKIHMKLAGTPFKLKVAALNATSSAIESTYAISGNKTVTVELIDDSGTDPSCNASVAACTACTKPVVATQTMTFTAADTGFKESANFTVNGAYSRLLARAKDGTATGCSVDVFSVRPTAFSAPSSSANNTALTGTPVFKAGTDTFTLSVTANASNYAGVSATPKINPAAMQSNGTGWVVGSFNPATFPEASASTASGNFTYSEVGNFRFNGYVPATDATSPRGIYDDTWTGIDQGAQSGCIAGSYSNTKDANGKYGCLFGLTANSAFFGRFVPDHFALVSGAVGQFCNGTTPFSYMGQPRLNIAYQLEARNGSNGKTSNYSAALTPAYPVTTPTLVAENRNAAHQGCDLAMRISGLPTVTWSAGTFTIPATNATFSRPTTHPVALDASSAATCAATRANANGPFWQLDIGVRMDDAGGGIITEAPSLPALDMNADTAGTCSGSGCNARRIGTTGQAFGRLRLLNTYGSELLPPRLEYRVEFWDDNRWATNANDTCTSIAAANLATGGLVVSNIIAPTNGVGFITFNVAATGSYDIAVNLNSSGTVTSCNATNPNGITPANMEWLQALWSNNCNGTPAWQQDPNARVRLGSPKAPYIYLRERY